MRALAWLVLVLSIETAALAAPDEAGKRLYARHCAQCHGEKGDGQGVAAPHLAPRPRDFTAGQFKIRTTPSGMLPTDDDLARIIRLGMPYTSMPAWPQLSRTDVAKLVDVVKSFSPHFDDPARLGEPIEIPEPQPPTPESIERGDVLYDDLGCADCHGERGRGDGPSGPTLADDWGRHIRAADLTKRWTFRGGPARRDVFRAFSTGLTGSPMPSYDFLEVEQSWDLVNYIFTLGPGDSPGYATLATARKVTRPLDLADAELFDGSPSAYFPVVGQVIEPVRAYHPACNGIAVRAVYNDEDLAIELRWHDIREDTSGGNAPDMPIPAEEDADPDFLPAADETEEGVPPSPSDPTSEFSDAVAVQFPNALPTTIRKPYFLFGDEQNPVDLWFADLGRAAPTLYEGRGGDALEPLGPRGLSVAQGYEHGEWRVVFKRRLRSQGEITFEEGAFVPIAFSVWDGFGRERGSKRGVTSWWTLYLEPGDRPSPVADMVRWGGAVFLAEIAFVGWAWRRRRGAGAAGGD